MKNIFEYSGEVGLLFFVTLAPVIAVLYGVYFVLTMLRPKTKPKSWAEQCDEWEQTQKTILAKRLTNQPNTPHT